MTYPNRNPAGYQGNNATYIPNVIKTDRAPTANDTRNVKVMDEWIDTSTDNWYKLVSLSAGVADWQLQISSGIGIDSVAVQTGTSPVVSDGTGLITFNGARVAAGTNPVRTDGTGANTVALEVQTAQAIAATNASNVGLAAFNNAHFSVDANGFVGLLGGGQAVDSVAVQTGTSPVVPTAAGVVTINGAVVAAGTNPIRTDGTGANTLAVEVQTSQAIPATNASNIGLAAFNSSHFSVDANGFVSLSGGGQAIDNIAMQTGTSPIGPDGAGLITLSGGTVAAGTNPIRTNGTGANTGVVQVQFAQAIASTNATNVGLSAFNSNNFSVDANGFVSLSAPGAVVQQVRTKTSAATTSAVIIPLDNTIPQITEGVEIFSLSITPKSATSTLIFNFFAFILLDSNTNATSIALFQDANVDAIFATSSLGGQQVPQIQAYPFTWYMTSGTTSATSFSVRFGPNAGGSTSTLNPFFSTASSCSLIITEVLT